VCQVSGSYYADVEADCQLFHVCVQVSDFEVSFRPALVPQKLFFRRKQIGYSEMVQVYYGR
jgi:hypothetical protein